MKFLFTTIQFQESEFYARVGEILAERGHEVAHLCYSRYSAKKLGRKGLRTYCLPDRMAALKLSGSQIEAEAREIPDRYGLGTLRDLYRGDKVCEGRSERWCAEWAVRHLLAIEQVVSDFQPDVLVPEVGCETLRTVSQHVGISRGKTVLFLLYTLFPNPLRLYRNTLHAPIVTPEQLKPLSDDQRQEVTDFIAAFTEANKPIREYRKARIGAMQLRDFFRHIAVKLTYDRDNDYLHPTRFVTNYLRERLRRERVGRLYRERDSSRPFVYFPLHVTDDYKIKGVIPHCMEQATLIEQVANSLPYGYDLVIKEHPMSIGRNDPAMLEQLTRTNNIVLVDPYTSSHRLIQESAAITVISSTVGLEALLYCKSVLTMGQPFYSGYGITVDVDSFREIPEKVGQLLKFEPDSETVTRFLYAAMHSCYPGKPVLVDRSEENAARLADSLDRAATAPA